MDILTLSFLYCLASAHQCVNVPSSETLRSWDDCETHGVVGDKAFEAKYPDWKLRNFTCAVMPTTEL